jgi:hypothetical protein
VDNRHRMHPLLFLIVVSALPSIVGLLGTPIAARLLAGVVAPGRWLLIVVGWAIGSTLAFAAWYRYGSPGPNERIGLVFIFLFSNGMLIVLVNAVACVVGAVLRVRRRKSS